MYKIDDNEKWQYLNSARKMMNRELFGTYAYIYTYYRKEFGYAFPSYEVMKKDLKVSERTLKQDIALLELYGFIVREKGHKGQNTRYYFPHYSTFQKITKEQISEFRKHYNKKKSAESSPENKNNNKVQILQDSSADFENSSADFDSFSVQNCDDYTNYYTNYEYTNYYTNYTETNGNKIEKEENEYILSQIEKWGEDIFNTDEED